MGEVYFFLEVLISGLLSGVLYALIALGFVLVYKASGVFNYAQGAMVVFAALTYAGLISTGASPIMAGVIAILMMVVLAILIEFLVLRRMINRSEESLFMVTIGVAYVINGAGQWMWGGDVSIIDINMPFGLYELGPVLIDKADVATAIISSVLVLVLSLFFSYTSMGRALRAVADDHQASVSVGVPIHKVWMLVWATAGLVAFITGLIWGARLGAQPALSIITLKALPVIILGGLTSIPGAICGGLIIGASEKLFEVYIGPIVGGATDTWFPYIIAILFLAIRPQGLFGDRPIRRI